MMSAANPARWRDARLFPPLATLALLVILTGAAPVDRFAFGAAPGPWLLGALYDARTGQPLAADQIRSIGPAAESRQDARPVTTPGGFLVRPDQGVSGLRFRRAGYPDAWVGVPTAGGWSMLPELALASLATGQTFNRLAGATLTSGDGRARLTIPPGAFLTDTPISLTPLSAETAPAFFPLGWSPVYLLHLGPESARPQAPLSLRLPGAEGALVAGIDPADGQWKRLEALAEGDALLVSIDSLGSLAVLVADPGEHGPEVPAVGAVLTAVSAGASPLTQSRVELSVAPETLLLSNESQVRLSARVNEARDVPSGTRIWVRVAEHYHFLDGGYLLHSPRDRELVLYRDGEGLTGAANLATVAGLEPARVQEGRIDVALGRRPAAPAWQVLGAAGGALTTAEGAVLEVPTGGLAAETLLGLDTAAVVGLDLPGLEGFELLADLRLTSNAVAVAPWTLAIPVPTGYRRESTCLVAQVVEVDGISHYRLVGPARLADDRLVLAAETIEPGWPGITGAGRYLFLIQPNPVAYLHGTVTGGTAEVMIRAAGFPIAAWASRGRYALAVPLTQARVDALDLTSGAATSAEIAPRGRDELLRQDLRLQPRGPALVSADPADQANDVMLSPTLRLTLDRALDPATLTPEQIRLTAGEVEVGLASELAADGLTLYLRPREPLARQTRYRLRLGAGLKDRYGNSLQDAPLTLSFMTMDDTPPPPPDPGKIAVGVLEAGLVPVTGGAGAAEPGMLVTVTNPSTQVVESVLVGEDGSFRLIIAAMLTDELTLTLHDQAGLTQVVPLGRPQPPPGMAVLGADGGRVETREGARLSLPGGVLGTDTIVDLKSLPPDQFPTPFGSDLQGEILGAVDLDLGGAEVPGVAALDLEVEGLPSFNVSDRVPLFRIQQQLAVPTDASPGTRLKIRLRGQDVAGRLTLIETDLRIVEPGTQDQDQPAPRVLERSGSPTLTLTLPEQATPGETVTITASADPPYLKLGFPLRGRRLSGEEQFLAFEVTERDDGWFWSLIDIAKVRTEPDGESRVETASPPYRGIRHDHSQLIMVMLYQTSVSFVQVLHSTVSADDPQAVIDALRDLPSQADPLKRIITIGVSMADQLRALNPVMRSLYEFSVIPVRSGVPGTIQVLDQRSNREAYQLRVDALAPGAMAAVVVLGEDDNPLKVTGTGSQNNHSVPLDAALSVAFSHVVDTATVKGDTLFVEDAKGHRVPAEIRFHERRDLDLGEREQRAFIARIKPLHRLKAGAAYHLVATPGIERPGGDPQRRMREPFRMPFTTAPPPRVVGRLELPGARSFDMLGDTAILAQTDIPAALNDFVTADLKDPSRPRVLARLPYAPDKSGPLWAVKGLPDVQFRNRKGGTVKGDLAVLSLGNGGVFSTVRALDVSRPEAPKVLTNAIVSLPLDVVHEKAKLVVMPTIGGLSVEGPAIGMGLGYESGGLTLDINATLGSVSFDPNLQGVEVREAYGANTTGIPQTTAIPHTIATQDSCRGAPRTGGRPGERETLDACWVYFVNQGLGVMTLDLARSIPPPPPNLRGERFGPSYLPKDKTGALVFRDAPSLREQSEALAIDTPAHLAFVGERVRVAGPIHDGAVASVLVNGFPARLGSDRNGRATDFEAEIRLREGPNAVRAEAFDRDGGQRGQAGLWVLRDYGANPLAGSRNIRMDLPALQVVSAAALEVTARVADIATFDEILINGRSASAKRCPPYARMRGNDCGWEGVGRVSVPLAPGLNSIVATIIDVDEEFPETLFYADLSVQEGLALAVKNDLFLFDAGGMLPIQTLPIGSAQRVSVVRGVSLDLDGDGRMGLDETQDGDPLTHFDEQMNLALVGERDNRLTFVDITTPHQARIIGRLPTPGPVFRSLYLRQEGIALVAVGDGLLLVDLARAAAADGLLDDDGDGRDDRILEQVELPGAQELVADESRGLVYVLQRGIGLAVLRLAPCDQDLAVDATFVVKERKLRYATLEQERDALLEALKLGLASAECAGIEIGPGPDQVGLLSQGSSACIWSESLACSSAYQPGLSDYDFELVVPDAQVPTAQACGEHMEKVIQEHPKFKSLDVSVFIVPRSVFDSAYRDVEPVEGKCGVGETDPHGDLCLGRNGLMLKWLLEGEWVTEGQAPARVVYNGGLDLDATLDHLSDPIEPPPAGGGPAPERSRRKDLRTGQWRDILVRGAPRQVTHVPLLEGVEWACLEDYAFNAARARIRIKGAGLGDVPVQDPLFLKKVQKAAKSGIRAVYGRLLSDERGNLLLLDVTRDAYRAGRGCRTAVADPDQVSSIDDFDDKPCESFEEYVVSRAIESAQRDLGILGRTLPEQREKALLAWEMFRRKADVGRQVTGEREANHFLLRVMDFIEELRGDAELRRRYETSRGHYTDGAARAANLTGCEGEKLPPVSPGGQDFVLEVPVRLYNAGLSGLAGAGLAFYHDGEEQKRVHADLAPGESRYFAKEPKPAGKSSAAPTAESTVPVMPKSHAVFAVVPRLDGAHQIQFLADPDDELTEFDKANNFDGFYYYVLNRGASPDPPATAGDRPEPPRPLLDPPASPVCLVEGKAPPSVSLELIATIADQYGASLRPGGQARLAWLLRNRGNVPLRGLSVRDTLVADAVVAGELAPGASLVREEPYQAPLRDGPRIGIATVEGLDPWGNGIGVASSATQINVGSPAEAPAVQIVSPRRTDPPYHTTAEAVPVWGLIESRLPLKQVLINGVAADLLPQGGGGRAWYRFDSREPVALTQPLTRIEVVAEDAQGNQARDWTLVAKDPANEIEVIKTVITDADRKAGRPPQLSARAQPGETVHYQVEVINHLDQPLFGVILSDPRMPQQPPPFELAAKGRKRFDYSLLIPADVAPGRLVNVAEARGFVGEGGNPWSGQPAFGSGRPVGPARGEAEVLVGQLILEPWILLLKNPGAYASGDEETDESEDRKRRQEEGTSRQLKVTFVDHARGREEDVTSTATGTRYEVYLTGGTLAWKDWLKQAADWLYQQASGDDKKPVHFAKIEVTPEGRLVARSNGINVVQAIHTRDGKEYASSPVLVIAGIAELDSVDIRPVSVLGYGAELGIGLAERLTERLLAREADADQAAGKPREPLIKPFMVLAQQGPMCGMPGKLLLQHGYAKLQDVRFKFLSGASDILYISGIDILGAAHTLVRGFGKGVATALIGLNTGSETAARWGGRAAGLAIDLLFQGASNWLLVEFAAGEKDGPVEVTTSGPLNGLVTARHSGWDEVKGKVDLSHYGWGVKEGGFWVIVGPELLSTEVRRGELLVPRGMREVALPLAPKGPGVTELRLTAAGRTLTRSVVVGTLLPGSGDPIRLPPTGFQVVRLPLLAAPAADDTQVSLAFNPPGVAALAEDVIPLRVGAADQALTFVVVGYQAGKHQGMQLPKGLRAALAALAKARGESFSGKVRIEILPDEPWLGVRNLSLAFSLELTTKDSLQASGMKLGFAAPNLMPGYLPMLDDQGKPRAGVARLLEVGEQVEPATAELVADRLGVAVTPNVPIAQALQEAATAGGLGTRVEHFLLQLITLSRQVHGESAGDVHLGCEVCVPLTGTGSDRYSPISQSGGALIQVREPPTNQGTCKDGPECGILAVETHRKQPRRITLTGFSPHGRRLLFEIDQAPGQGRLTGLPSRSALGVASVLYTPDERAYEGLDFFSYRVNDGECVSASCLVGIEEVNRPPAPPEEGADGDDPNAGGGAGLIRHPKSGFTQPVPAVMAGTDPDEDPLEIRVTGQPSKGRLELGTPVHQGQRTELAFTYVPNGRDSGADEVRYSVSDGEHSSSGAVGFFINAPPRCFDLRVPEPVSPGGSVDFGFALSDPDAGQGGGPAASLTVEIRRLPTRGTIDQARPIYHADAAAQPGSDRFVYRVLDGLDASDECAVELEINAAPRIRAPTGPLVVPRNRADVPIVLEATDEPGSALSFTTPPVTQWGTLTAPTRTGPQSAVVHYTPLPGFAGPDGFSFKVVDSGGLTDEGKIAIRVNRPPTAVEDQVRMTEGQAVEIDVMANDFDRDGHVVAVVEVDQVSQADVSILPPVRTRGGLSRTRLLFAPHPGALGYFELGYLILDNDGAHGEGRVRLWVEARNRLPLAVGDQAAVSPDSAVDVAVLDNDSDADGDTLSILEVGRPANGTIKNLGDRIRYWPAPGFTGQDRLEYRVGDGRGGTGQASVDILVQPES